ncbi:GET complex subunit get1 [Lambiella insularis]|nr:GET complex subunit get1 [Lambiella insularis]
MDLELDLDLASPQMNVSLAFQWTLDQTVDHFIKVGTDVLLTATRDNVQLIALLACERFGATLAICPATRSKIERLLQSQTGNVVVGFLKTKIGFPTGDSANQLAQSLAGVNFLALAAALVSTTDTFEAGTALENMIAASATDKTLAPTAHHLKDLLNVLEPRLNRAGFMDEVLNWKAWWMGSDRFTEPERTHILEHGESFPSADGLEKIVMALRAAFRVGPATDITLTARSAAPWLTAFVTWCIGVCPTIYSHDGHAIHSEPDVPLKIVYSKHQSFDTEIKIEITNTLTSFQEVISASLVNFGRDQAHLAAGMTQIHIYAKHVIARLGFDSDLAYRMLLQVLPYALSQVRDEMVSNTMCQSFQLLDYESLPIKVVPANLFPQGSVVAHAMKTYLALGENINLVKLPEGTLISDLPLASLWLEKVKYDSLYRFFMAAKIPFWYTTLPIGIKSGVKELRVASVLAWACKLLRHDVSQDLDGWAGSSFRGQVIFPKIFESQVLQEDGYLELFCIPGLLTMGKDRYQSFNLIKCQQTTPLARDDKIEALAVTRSLNMFPDERLLWNVRIQDNCLLVYMCSSRSTHHQKISPRDTRRAGSTWFESEKTGYHIVLRNIGSKASNDAVITAGGAINNLLWILYNKLPTSTSANVQSQTILRREVVRLKREMNSTSSQDEFAKWAKLRRQHDKVLAEYEQKTQSLQSFKGQFDSAVGVLRWLGTNGLRVFLQFWFQKQPMFWLPRGWVPGYVEWILAFPRAQTGSISIQVWGIACASVVQIASTTIKAVWVLAPGQKQEVKGKPEPMNMGARGGGQEFNENVPPGRGERKEL